MHIINFKMGMFKDCGCGCKGKKQEQKFLISIMSSLVFFIVANPETFRFVRKIFGSWVSSPTGCPTTRGLLLHTVVFLLITWGMMNIKREGFEMEMKPSAPAPAPKPVPKPVPVPKPAPAPKAPPAMVNVPSPLPGMVEPQYGFVDSGSSLGFMDLTTETDLPMSGSFQKESGETVTCSCTDGKKVTISS